MCLRFLFNFYSLTSASDALAAAARRERLYAHQRTERMVRRALSACAGTHAKLLRKSHAGAARPSESAATRSFGFGFTRSHSGIYHNNIMNYHIRYAHYLPVLDLIRCWRRETFSVSCPQCIWCPRHSILFRYIITRTRACTHACVRRCEAAKLPCWRRRHARTHAHTRTHALARPHIPVKHSLL